MTIADLSNLANDGAAIGQTWSSATESVMSVMSEMESALWPVISEMENAVAAGASTAQAQADWTSLFSGSSVAPSAINQAFADLVQTIHDSHVTTADLSTLAADETAFNDLINIETGYDSDVQQRFSAEGLNYDGYGYDVDPSGGGLLLTTPLLTSMGVVTDQLPLSFDLLVASGQAATEQEALSSEYASLAEKSGLTVADLTNLAADSQAIMSVLNLGTGIGVNTFGVANAVDELVQALTGGTSIAHAQADLFASFSPGRPRGMVDETFDDLVQTIEDSHVTSADLTAVAADQAALASDGYTLLDPVTQQSLPLAPIANPTGSTSSSSTGSPSGSSGVGTTTPTSLVTRSLGTVSKDKAKARQKSDHKETVKDLRHSDHHLRRKSQLRARDVKEHTTERDGR